MKSPPFCACCAHALEPAASSGPRSGHSNVRTALTADPRWVVAHRLSPNTTVPRNARFRSLQPLLSPCAGLPLARRAGFSDSSLRDAAHEIHGLLKRTDDMGAGLVRMVDSIKGR